MSLTFGNNKWTLTGRQSLISVVAAKYRERPAIIKAALVTLLRLCLTLAGLTAGAIAGFHVAEWLGWFIIALDCLIVEWVVKR